MAGQGVATGKISLAVELIDNYKQIASQLKNGLKGNLKDYELDVGFNDKKLAEQAESELGKINELLSNSKFKDLDWSNVIPPLTQVLVSDDLAESVKVQIIEGFRKGIEEIPQYYNEFTKNGASKWEKIKPGEEIAQQVLGASIFNEAIESFGMGKMDTRRFKKQYQGALGGTGQFNDKIIKDIIQMMSNVSLISADKKNKEILPYLLGGTAAKDQLDELFAKSGSKTDKFSRPDLQRAAALTERLKYIASQNPTDTNTNAYADAEKNLEKIIQNITNPEKGGKYTQEDISTIIGNIRDRIAAASKERDRLYQEYNPQQYAQKDIPDLLNRLRELVQGKQSEQVKSVIDQYDKANTLDWDQLFNIVTPDEEPIDLRYSDVVTNWLESLADKVADQRSEEKQRRDDEARRKAQIAQGFKNLLNIYGKTGVDSSAENIEGMVDPSVFTDKLEGDVDHLTEQRQEVEKQADELQRAKEELEKENTAIVDVINGSYEQKGKTAAKKQLLEKQQAYDEADESNKDLAWIEYYKAYENMVEGNNGKNMPSNLDKLKTWDKKESLAERLAREFGDEKEFNTDGLREHIINLKQKWIENSTELKNLLKTIADVESQKRAINEQITNLQTEESKPAETAPEPTPDTQEIVDVGQLEQQRKALEEELKELERQYQKQQELNSAIQDIIESINEGDPATKYKSEAEIVLEHMYDSNNDDIRDLAQYWESSGETGASFGALEGYGEDVQEKLDNLKEQIEARQEKVKEINETIRQMSPTSIETPEKEVISGETDGHATKEQLEKYITTYKNIREQLKKARDEVNKILADKDNFDPESLFDHQNAQIAKWAEDSDVITIDSFQTFADSLEQKISYWEGRIQQTQNALNDLTNQNGGIPTETIDESATRATGAVEGLSQAQQQGNQVGQQAADTAQNAATAMQAEAEAANADAEAQRELAAQRQNANNAQPSSTPANPVPAPTPEAPPTHPETPVRTGNVDGINEEADAAENAMFKFMSAAEAKEAFVAANKDANASAEETAKGIDKESQAAENAKLGFDPEKLQTAIDTTQKIHELLTQVSTTIGQMDNSSEFTGITEQLKTVAEAMQLITESAQQIGSAMSAVQAEGGLKVDLQNGLDINPLIGQFETLNEEVIALVASLASVQSAIGAVDDNSGLPILLSQIQTIADSLQTISQKDLGVNFNISNTGNAVQQQAAKDREALKELRSQAEALGKYFESNLGKDWEGMLKREDGDNYFKTPWSTQDVLDDKKSTNEEKMEAYKRRIEDLKQYAIEAGATVESILPKMAETPEKVIDDAKSFALKNTPIETLKQIFGADKSTVLDAISGKIQEIIGQLNTLNSTLSSLSDGSNLTGLKEVFEQIPQKIEEATNKIFELRQQIDTAQFSQGFDEQFKGLTEQLEAAKEQTKATNEELAKTKKLLDEETQARKQLQSEVDKHRTQEASDQQKANAEEKKALETEKNNLVKQLEAERKERTEKAEAQNKSLLDEQAKQQNRIELEQIKAAERAEKARQQAIADRAKAQQAAAKAAEKAQINREDTSLSADYGRYKADYKEMYDATTVEQYNTALQHTLETEERIRLAREQSILAHGTADQIMQRAAGLSDTTLEGGFVEGFEKATQAQLDAMRAIETMRTNFVDKQQSSVNTFAEQIQSLNTGITPEVVTGWGDAQQAEYQKITEGANLATVAIESLNRMIAEMRSGQFDFTDQNSMETFMTLKEGLPDVIQQMQDSTKNLNANVDSSVKKATTELDKAQTVLQNIKNNSKDFIVVDDNLAITLEEIETHLNKIKELKDILNNSPLSILNKDFANNFNSYLGQLNGNDNEVGIIGEAQENYKHSKTDFGKIPSYFSSYATALNGLFSELNKGTNVSIKQLEEKLKIVDYYAQRLKETTGLNRDQLLSVDPLRDTNATQAMIDAQEAARGKVGSAFEKNLTDIQSKINETENVLKNLFKDFDTSGLSKIGENYVGNGTEFDSFITSAQQASEALSNLEKIRDNAKDNPLFFQDKNNLEEYHTLLEQLDQDLETVSKGASDFRIVDPNAIQRAKTEMAQFLRSPGLTEDERSQVQDFYNQMQEGINKVTFDNLTKGFDNVKQKAIEAGHTGDTFFSMLTQRFKSLGAYLLSFVSFYRVIGVFKDGINIIKELDSALTEMNKVSTESLNTLMQYQKESFNIANDVGTTAVQIQQSTADFIRLGKLNCLFI